MGTEEDGQVSAYREWEKYKNQWSW